MKIKIITTAFILVFIILASTGYSQTRTPRINHRQEHQQKRIGNGVKDGELTARETARLEGREAKIQHDKRVAKSDGVVTGSERKKLRREENRTSRAIYRQKHDAQERH
ncbi:MAG: hypothetical protein JST09_06740 [Bacteroidetes bacterium]|nr:hypothetical protein [Bacteroidota bacterium]